ncbi:MAG: fatty acid--CoA ligase family protein [Thermoleophilia bacterium]|nr:fatty acid--CoA ligase family protein [Thermoleophilia bacterium]
MTDDEGTRGDLEFGTIARLVRSAAERHGARDAIVDGDTTLSFAEIAEHVRRVACAFIRSAIAPGDRVAIWGANSWQWEVAALAAHSVGAVLVPINTRFKGAEAGYVLTRSRARLLFTECDLLGADLHAMLRVAGVDLPHLERVVALRGSARGDVTPWSAFVAAGEGVPDDEVERRALAVAPDDLGDILFTSGTTGHPKGVVATHAQSLRAFRDWSDIVGLRAGDRYLVAMPYFHTFGYKAGWLASLMTGATVFPQPIFDVDDVLVRVARDRITVLPGPPALYQTILAKPDLRDRDLSSLRLAVTGAAAIPVELIHRMRSELAFETIVTAYGLTEATGVSTMCRTGDAAETIATTSGRAIPGVEVRVVDDAGTETARGDAGEIVVRGYTVMRGYLDDAAETAAAIDDAGWLHTGDVGVMDARGYIRITDRKKDMFIVGGFNAYPAEIERVILQHASVAQAAVVGAPDERLGEIGVAFVVPRAGSALLPEELIAFCRDRMANYKVPRRVEVTDSLPMNATGKVLKYVLRERARAR